MSHQDIIIGGRRIGPSQPPFIIAEMSGNHNQSLDRALAIVDAAAEAGAHAVKLQTYTAEAMTLDIAEGDFFISGETDPWRGQSMFELYEKAYTPWEWHAPILKRCRERGLICFSTPFDETAVDFLDEIGVPAFKIASFENTDLPLIRKAAAKGKPMLISTGMSGAGELDEAVRAVREAGCSDIVLLKCTSTYPAEPRDVNLSTIPHMRELFGAHVGLSDHSMGVGVACAAVALGAVLVEKHFTLSRAEGGVDSAFSLEPAELALLQSETEKAWMSLGKVHYGPAEREKPFVTDKRSIYVVKNMAKGEAFTADNIRVIRPGHGLAPKFIDLVYGRKAAEDIKRGTALGWELIA
jgi:N-acetylneuraminate synthase